MGSKYLAAISPASSQPTGPAEQSKKEERMKRDRIYANRGVGRQTTTNDNNIFSMLNVCDTGFVFRQ
jgi:hypothetical protein